MLDGAHEPHHGQQKQKNPAYQYSYENTGLCEISGAIHYHHYSDK